MTRSIKSWILTAILFSLAGALIGALLASHSIHRLSQGAEAISRFERLWSDAVETDIRATNMAQRSVLLHAQGDLSRFEAANDRRVDQLLEAVASVPSGASSDTVAAIYDLVRLKGEIELGAVAFAANGRAQTGISMLVVAHYASLAGHAAQALKTLRDDLTSALAREQRQAGQFMIASLLVLFLCVALAGSCWWRVGKLFREQAVELSQAHRELGAHAVELEVRIAERTSDLEAAKSAAEAADRAKSAFLAQMSHEIRTPLNGVLGMAEALSRTALDERQSRMLSVVRESGSTLLALLNDVLDLAKIESGKMELENIPFQADSIVRSAEAVFTSRAHEKGISLAVRATGDVDGWCQGDPTRLRQVLYNLVSNAVKFTERGGVMIDLDVSMPHKGVRTLCIEVRDTGIGMDEEARSRLFDRFSQADASTTRRFGGSGLGLAICQQLISTMGGRIEVESQPGTGSLFRVSLDLQVAHRPQSVVLSPQIGSAAAEQDSLVPADSPDAGEAMDEPGGQDLRILAADDNAHNRLVLQLMLEHIGLEAVFAHDGAEALAMWEQEHFDLILMDIQMPVMCGHDATRQIRAREAATGRRRTPVVALTANAMTHHVRECLDAGMDDHVAKPIRPERLFAAIEQALSKPETWDQGHAADQSATG
ncbi:MAG: ATP-binding protein [Hyphomonadaceae bacterium]|jgi:signal transduction histidine kinase/ActR/RegA family two-component response regulator|nr:ATP-binding protein [Hyphomonadaceae bacterium]